VLINSLTIETHQLSVFAVGDGSVSFVSSNGIARTPQEIAGVSLDKFLGIWIIPNYLALGFSVAFGLEQNLASRRSELAGPRSIRISADLRRSPVAVVNRGTAPKSAF
jgi:hypothetical protein